MEEIKLRGPVEYIKEAWKIYTKKENMTYFIKVMSIVVISSSVVSYLLGYLYPSNTYPQDGDVANIVFYFVLTLLSIFLSMWMQSSTYFSILEMNNNVGDVIKKSLKKLLPFFGVSFVLGIIFMLGTLLLIIPGIIFGIWYSYTLFLVFERNMKLGQALKTSKELVRGRMLKVFGRGLVFGLFMLFVSILISIIPFAGSVIAGLVSPLFVLPSYLLYRDLSANRGL